MHPLDKSPRKHVDIQDESLVFNGTKCVFFGIDASHLPIGHSTNHQLTSNQQASDQSRT